MNIIVTGASRGIGYEVVKKLAKLENNLIIAISRNKEKIELLAKECNNNSSNSKVIALPFDLENDNYKVLFQKINNSINHLDILINNAGFLVSGKFTEITESESKRIFEINFFAPAKLIQLFYPLLRFAKSSHVVNISSMGGFQGSEKFNGLSYYSASKAALASLSECLALEFKEDNIKVNCLALGAVQTEMLAEAFPGYNAPLKSNEMAEFIVDFALKGSRFYNGKVLPVSLSTP